MDLQRLFLFLIFAFSLALVWDGWQRYQHPEQYIQQNVVANEGLPKPQAATSAVIEKVAVNQPLPAQAAGKIIQVKTNFLEAEINTVGGDIQRLALLQHPDGQDKNKPFVLFQKGAGTHNYIAQSGLLGEGLPNHNSLFVAERDVYSLADKADRVQVRLAATSLSGVKIAKVLTFQKDSYLVDVAYEIDNGGNTPLNASAYFQLLRDSAPPEGASKLVPTYTGPAVYTEKEKFQKVEFSTIDKGKVEYPKDSDNGWIGMLQHYFVAAWLPKDKANREFFTRKLDGGLYSAGVVLPVPAIAPGQKAVISVPLYAGPAQSSLDKIAPGLGLTVDYGWLTVIATPIFWLMALLQSFVHNWGVAIILLTVLIKLAFFPLSAASYRSMAKMRVVAPKLEKIKQQYADDREQLNKAMMELYKTEKINPLGGCLPVVIQIPVFIALYWSILASVEMRYAPFFGWITDLSAADPYYVLPIIMGASMIIQMRLNPTPPDPMQAKVMQIMPIVFSIIFFFFPAGLVLYSIVNNILSIAQQWYITKAAEDESKGIAAKR
ncbi:MAG: membrane protein insertase YidC [Gallionellaceae bacterium]|jgi:YidC/Oxa1 family membrane protein insertase|nr:membrane protein insertase YidC [Gallionellaceae bacterium]